MEDPQSFSQRLEASLDARRDKLDRTEMAKLRDALKLFQAAFQGLKAVLFKKGVLHDDPYKYELKISEVKNPPEGPFSESEKVDQISLRVSQFEAYLEFLNNYYQFTCDFLTMGRIKRVLALVKYFNFQQFTETSTQPNTRALAEIAGLVKKGTDQLSSGLIAESASQLERATRDALAMLKELAAYHRERYKLELRQLVMVGIPLDSDLAIGRRDDAMRLIKRKFAEVAGELAFYPELVEEVLNEDWSSDGPALREELLKRFAVEEEKKAVAAKERSYRGTLMDGTRALAGAAWSIDAAAAKLGEDSALLSSLDQGLGARLRRMISKIFSPGEARLEYEVVFVDQLSGKKTVEKVDFKAFVEDAGKKARLLSSLNQRAGASVKRLEGTTEELVYQFLQRNIEETQRILRIFGALEEYFKSSLPAELRPKMRSVRPEATTIKGAIIKANQKKHEYVSQREEAEQMKRLGIKDAGT
jgi:hypothetical protein